MTQRMFERSSGILLHPTSLPGAYGIGDFGPQAFRFVDFLAEAKQGLWQILPLGPVGSGYSPYDSHSASAGNPSLIALEPMSEMGLLEREWFDTITPVAAGTADFRLAEQAKSAGLRRAFDRFQVVGSPALQTALREFREHESDWLEDFALYAALREAHERQPWHLWEDELVQREPATLDRWRRRLEQEISYQVFVQFIFSEQWSSLKRYANERGIRIVGDIPIYVAHDSADVWANQHLFTLGDDGRPQLVAGVPPDLFSESGQLWGNPCYRWDVIASEGYRWWIERFRRVFELTDIVRVDHFRAFQAGWQVPASETTAINGTWVPGPGTDLFDAVFSELGHLPIIVEDLGIITDDVHALREKLGYPGMKVLQFAFGGDSDNPYLPHNYIPNAVVYTGTHDNDTTVGWYQNASAAERDHVNRYFGGEAHDISWDLIRLALASVAVLSIAPLQDVLCIGREGRMNLPGTSEGNWLWRFKAEDLTSKHARRLADLTALYGRTAGS